MSCHIFQDDYQKSLLWLCGRYNTFLCVFICCMHYWIKSVTKPKYFKCVKLNITCFVAIQYSTTKWHRTSKIKQVRHQTTHTSSVMPARMRLKRFLSRRESSSRSRSASGLFCLMGASGSSSVTSGLLKPPLDWFLLSFRVWSVFSLHMNNPP